MKRNYNKIWQFIASCFCAATIYYANQQPVIIIKEVVKYNSIPTTMATTMDVECTAYTAGYESCGKLPNDPAYGITANGNKVRKGIVAADTSILPFGTKVYIEGLGVFVVDDTGGDIKGNRIDIYMEDMSAAINFGRQYRKLIILDKS